MAIPTPTLQVINRGDFLNDPSAENVYTSFGKAKTNFSNIWTMLENQGYEKIFLSLNGITTDGKTEMEYIAEAIERGKATGGGAYGGVWTVKPIGRKPLFYTITPTGESGLTGTPNPNLGFDYRFYRVHNKGQVFGGGGGVFINADRISPAGSFSIGGTGSGTSSDIYIDLGNIGTANIWTSFNLGDAGNPWTITGLSLVTAIQNGISRTWSFTGNQRLDIDTGEWGGSDIFNPAYLAATEDDFDLLSNQPVVFPDLFVTKSSRKYRDYILTTEIPIALTLTPEYSTFNINVTGGVGEIKGFSAFSNPSTYDGMDIYLKNEGLIDLILLHNNGTVSVPFFFKTEANITLTTNDIMHFKYNLSLNVVEFVGVAEIPNLPIPFGNLRILKIEGNANANAIEAGDVVTASMLNSNIFLTVGEYVAGDVMELASYDPTTYDYLDLS